MNNDTLSKPTVPGKICWPGGSLTKQCFPFPNTTIYYIAMNPSSPKGYNKMIQACKYFFETNPILIVKNMNEKSICSNEKKCTKECCIKININDTSSKFWLTAELNLNKVTSTFISSSLCPKIYQCGIKKLALNDTKISFDDFKSLAFSAAIVELIDASMTHVDGNVVMLEAILEALPNVVEFLFKVTDISTITSSTAKNISNLQNLSHLRRLTLLCIPEAFSLNDVIAFSKNRRDIWFTLHYSQHKISAEFSNQINAFVAVEKQKMLVDRNLFFI